MVLDGDRSAVCDLTVEHLDGVRRVSGLEEFYEDLFFDKGTGKFSSGGLMEKERKWGGRTETD